MLRAAMDTLLGHDVGPTLAPLDRMANGARDRQAGDGDRLAPTRLPTVVDVEESAPPGTTDRARRRPRADSHDGGGHPPLGRATNPWRTAEARHRRPSGDRGDIHGPPAPAALADLAHVLDQSRRPDRRSRFLRGPDRDYRLVFVLVCLAHERRRIRHVAVTTHPTAAWTAQPLREAYPWDEAPRYLIHDRDHAFDALGATATAMGIEEMRTAPHAPGQNVLFVERFVGYERRVDCRGSCCGHDDHTGSLTPKKLLGTPDRPKAGDVSRLQPLARILDPQFLACRIAMASRGPLT